MTMEKRFENLTELIDYHIRLHKGVELQDIYKLAHQSIFGPEHLGPAAGEGAILEEMQSPDIGFEEPLLEPISVDVNACRINLRVARRQKIPPALIAETMRQSIEKFSRDRDDFVHLWEKVRNSLQVLAIRFDSGQFEELTRVMREKYFPPLHHSTSYRDHNHPAYRVLMTREFERLMRPSSDGGRLP